MMKGLLKERGIVSVLDYNHNALEWNSLPPDSMLLFYNLLLEWRQGAGMNSQIAVDLLCFSNKRD